MSQLPYCNTERVFIALFGTCPVIKGIVSIRAYYHFGQTISRTTDLSTSYVSILLNNNNTYAYVYSPNHIERSLSDESKSDEKKARNFIP